MGLLTRSMASLMRSDFMRPLVARLAMSAALLEPLERQAMSRSSASGLGVCEFWERRIADGGDCAENGLGN